MKTFYVVVKKRIVNKRLRVYVPLCNGAVFTDEADAWFWADHYFAEVLSFRHHG